MATPRRVAEVLLSEALAEPLGLGGPGRATQSQVHYLTDLTGGRVPVCQNASGMLVSAWIDVLLSRRRLEALERLRPGVGDLVTVEPIEDWLGREAGELPRVYLRGPELISTITSDGHLRFVDRQRSVSPEWVRIEIGAVELAGADPRRSLQR